MRHSMPIQDNHLAVLARKNAGGGGSPWTQTLSSGTNQISCGDIAAQQWIAFSFTSDGTTGNFESVTASMRYQGTPTTETFDVYIYDDNTGEPGSQLTGAANSNNNLSALSATYQNETFTLDSPAARAASTVYWIVFHADQVDATHFFRVQTDATDVNGARSRSADGVTWSSQDTSSLMNGQLDGTQ